jgi:hypothetical protein
MSFVDEEKFNILSQDLLVYITHLEEAFNSIGESEEKIIIQVDRIVFLIIKIPYLKSKWLLV